MRRAAISIPANIVEGFKKRGLSDKTRFLNIAQGSLEECRYYLILIQDLGYGTATDTEALLEEVSKLLIGYASAIESNRWASHKFCLLQLLSAALSEPNRTQRCALIISVTRAPELLNSFFPYLTNPQWLENGQ